MSETYDENERIPFDETGMRWVSGHNTIDIDEDGITVYPKVYEHTNGDVSFDLEYVNEMLTKHKLKVSFDALMHNFKAWLDDCRSGYADVENDVYVFSACCHNDLFFMVERLHGDTSRKTYKC